MSVEWPIVPLGKLVKVKGGKRLPKNSSLQKEKNTHPYIRVRDMGCRLLPDTGLEYVPDDVFPKIQRYIVEENDLIISIVGTIGLVSFIDERFHLASQTENCAKLSGLDRLDALCLYYYLKSSSGQQHIKEATVGAVQAKLPLYNIEKLPVVWPDKHIRSSIVSSLGSIDDKIELNRQINQTLENMAEVVFNSWFVNFEPTHAKIRAKENGQDPERAAMAAIAGKPVDQLDTLSDKQLETLKSTAALFPDTLVDSEVGEIPEGWGVETLEGLIELSYGKALKKTDRVEGDFPVYGSGGLTGTHNKPLVEGPGIIVGRKGTVGSLYWEDQSFFPIDTVFYVQCKGEVTLEYVYYLLQTLGLENMNTDAAVPGLNRNNAYRLEVPKVPNSLISAYSIFTKILRNKMSIAQDEIKTLELLRETLLPKLLSGEIDLSEAA